MKDYNQKAAAIRAGYSPKTAATQACMILNRPEVKKYLNKLIEEQEFKCEVDAQRVVTELARLAFYDIGTFYKRNEDNKLVPKELDELTPDQRAAIQEYDPETGTFKLFSKDPALDKLGKYTKLYSEIDPQITTNFVIMPLVRIGGKEVEFNVGRPSPKKINGAEIPT